MARSDVIKQLWVYIKEKDLQDPADKRVIVCDDLMVNVFKKPKVQMFKMVKALEKHMKLKEDVVL